jgi:2-dehydropantoate 2-reductase
MIARADAAKLLMPRLRMIYTHLKTYEAQRG